MKLLSVPRDLKDLDRDESGQLTVEWVLLTGAVILPFVLTIPGIISMFRTYFYRIAGVISCPFP
ncbi:MAG: TadE/TadG family type IV pilus assembly protein [Planctomycetota bacterium JB042]